jgi:RNA polymerase sigma-70 factor (ECF subfamily)
MKSIEADWGAIAERHAQSVWRAARRLVPDDEAAWDCVQEAFLTALSSRAPGDLADPIGWICGVARNHARHAVRSRGRFRRFLERLVLRKPVLSEGVPPDGREALNLALSRLPARLRDAVVLRHLARMSIAEVAQAQGISESAAKSRVHRGLGRLRAMLGGSLAVALLARAAQAGWSGPLTGLVAAAKAAAPATLPAIAAVSVPKVLALAGFVAAAAASGLFLASSAEEPDEPPRLLAADAGAPEALLPALRGGLHVAEAAVRPDAGVPPSTVPAPEPVEILVRDLADGTGAQGVQIVLPSLGKHVVTDGAGRFELPLEGLDRLEVKGEGWKALAHPPGEIAARREIWVYRTIRVLGTVTGDTHRATKTKHRSKSKRYRIFDPRRATLSAVPVSDATLAEPAPVPWNPEWLRERGLGPTGDLGKPDRYGRFEVEVPAIRDLALVAHTPGWKPGHAFVRFVPGAEFAGRLSIHLRPATIVHGRVSSRRKSRIAVYMLEASTPERLQPDLLPLVGHPYSVEMRGKEAAVSFVASTTTTWGDRFEIPVYVEGDAIVVTEPAEDPGAVVSRVEIRKGRDLELEIKVDRLEKRGLVFLRFERGESPRGERVWITGEPDRARQPTVSVPLPRFASIRCIPEELLDHGDDYEVRWTVGEPSREVSARFEWRRQRSVDLRGAKPVTPLRTAPR